ncbi:DUF6328 family protein [Nocardioides litoris]|uniref:DUF6328 family protein n=1 Tax=Nocardioides litoris TaxID=1926648 RepID=UPI00111DA5B4|nr:DUF6328 family protein [Nocardioides litoris]
MTAGPSGTGAETASDRITRNWNELLQELRVTQTGSQILAGFLLTVPFSTRYDELSAAQVRVYLAIISCSVLSTGCLVAPVAFHRVLFRQRQRPWLVEAANRAARVGLGLLALTVSGVLSLVFDVTVGRAPALVALAVGLAFLLGLWVVVPLLHRGDSEQDEPLRP